MNLDQLLMVFEVIFMIIALVLVLGGGPSGGRYDSYWGARLWYEPGAFRNGFKGFCAVFVTAAFSFAGTERGYSYSNLNVRIELIEFLPSRRSCRRGICKPRQSPARCDQASLLANHPLLHSRTLLRRFARCIQ